MYRRISSLLALLLIAGMAPLRAESREQPTWTALSFSGASQGWVAGHTTRAAFMAHTVNGGRSWTRQTVGFYVDQMQFIDASTGWAVVSSPLRCGTHPLCTWQIVATHNAGKTWQRQRSSGRCWHISSLQFISATEGWAVEANDLCASAQRTIATHLIATQDGGRTWHVAFAPSLRLTSVHFGSPTQGWATADAWSGSHPRCQTVVYHTASAGRTWAQQTAVQGYCSGRADFVDASHGWLLLTNIGACSMGGCYDNRLYHTVDGGTHWMVQQQVRQMGASWSGRSGFLQRPIFVTSAVGYIAVSAGASTGAGGIAVTHDGGQHWTRSQPYGLEVADMSPVDAQNAWAIGCVQHTATCAWLLHTATAGQTWSRTTP